MNNETVLTDEELLKLNRRGLIPGPLESMSEFYQRVQYCLHLSENLNIPLDKTILSDSNADLRYFYDVAIDWIPIVFSNERLAPWHGGCAWIFQAKANDPLGAFIQLRKTFKDHTKFLWIYNRDELLKHELAHVGRMKFEEPKYEEFFAYGTSCSWFRKWFGPLVQSSKESVIFVMVLLSILIFDIFLLTVGHYEGFEIALMLKMIPLTLIVLALIRLVRKHLVYNRCIKKLTSCLQDGHKARSVAYRLSDKEIFSFGQLNNEQIYQYAKLQSDQEIRWKVIQQVYFH